MSTTDTPQQTSGETRSGYLTTRDGVRLHYLEAGVGPHMLLVPGWSQTAAQWGKQIEDFSRTHHVVALDLRGHGDSDTPAHGYRIARLAADVHEALSILDLDEVVVIAHSMGCSVMWSYWDLFGAERLSSLVLVDQPAVQVADPAWPEGEAAKLAAIFDHATISDLVGGLRGDDAEAVTRRVIGGMFTAHTPPAEVEWAIQRNLTFARANAGTLFIDHCYQDWRDVLARITVPTLVVAGEISIFPASGVQWVAEQIPGAQLRIFSGDERGGHFMFWENSTLFNQVVRDFLDGSLRSSGQALEHGSDT